MYYTYILFSFKDSGYYFGHTSDLEKRLAQYNSGQVKSTRNRKPFKIHYSETFKTKTEANRRELFFKSFEGRKWVIEKNIILPR